MVRLINCVRKRTDINTADFRRYWNSNEFENLFQQLFAIAKPVIYARNLTLQVGANIKIMEERGSSEPFDGTLEFVWDSAADLIEKFDAPHARKLREEMLEYQKQFIDIERCHAFFTEYEPKQL